jgi:hypothetical protein
MTFKGNGYKSQNLTVTPNWARKSKNKPILDRKEVAYGWIVEGDYGVTEVMTTNKDGKKVIDQVATSPIRDVAIQKLFNYYNKHYSARNLQIAKSNTWVEDVRVPMRPGSKLLSYVLIDARAFDNIAEVGKYTLQLVPDGATLHTLAEDYIGYFHVNDATDMGHRARIGEILKANNIDIEAADEESIELWISGVNQDTTFKTSFKGTAKIYLPVISLPEPPNPAFIISMEIGEIQDLITRANINLEAYKRKIDNFEDSFGKVENLDLGEQILSLQQFYPSLINHMAFNDVAVKNVLDDEINIFLNEDYEVIYIAVNRAGEKIPLLKGMPGLSSSSPFNSLRTMALLNKIENIASIGTTTVLKVQNQEFYAPKIPWEDFVEKYIVPPVVIKNSDPGKLFDQLLETNSVVAGLALKFSKESSKTGKDLEEELAVLANPEIMAAAVSQEENSVSSTTDQVIKGLSRFSEKVGQTAPGASAKRMLQGTYSEVLNRIPLDKLIKETIDCLKKLLTCREMIEGILDKNIMLGYGTFKVKLPAGSSFLADRALHIAQSGQYIVEGIDYSEADLPAYNTEGLKFLAVLELAFKKEGLDDFDRVLAEVCATIENPPIDKLLNIFKIPTIAFPDTLPVVDLQASIVDMLEEAIIQLLTGLIVEMVQAILDEILWFCKEDTEATPEDTDFGASDLLGAMANKVGAGSITDLLADFYDAMGDQPPGSSAAAEDQLLDVIGSCELPNGTVAAISKRECIASGGVFTDPSSGVSADADSLLDLNSGTENQDLLKDIARKCSLVKKLLSDLSAILTPAELSALFNATASPVVLDTILDVIQVRHPELYAKVNTREKVVVMFGTLEKMVDVSAVLAQITTISRGLGCTFESKCIREELRRDNFLEDVPDEDTTKRILELLDDPTDFEIPSTFCEERGSSIDNGLIPKDSASLLFLLDKVIGVMYDGIYMAYDGEATRIPDSLSVPFERKKRVERTTLQGAKIDFDIFNFLKMQEEKFTVEFPDWLPKKTVMNPEFQRLVSQGYIPPDGDPQGQFGPYTTEKVKIAGILPTPFNSFPLDAVTVPETFLRFAADSKYGLEKINDIRVGTDPVNNSMYFALSEPYKAGGSFKPSTFSLKFTLAPAKDSNDYRNTFLLQIGDIPVDPSTIPIGGNLPDGQVTPSISFGPFESAIYRSRLPGVNTVSSKAEQIIELLQEKTGNKLITPGAIPQTDVLYGFVNSVAEAATMTVPPSLKDFVYKKMYGDLLTQMMSNIGSEILDTPLFKRSKEDKTPFIKLIDWAPIPTDEERECNFDPHILALDTVKKRTREAYEQYIKCSPLEDEIAVDGLGRTNLSALEAAGMTGCVMTTIRTYALEQLMRSMYPVSVFAGEEFVSKLTVEYIIEETLRGVKKFGQAYYDSFLTQVEVIFGLRMKPFSPFGSVPEILEQSAEIGITWMYADAAIKEFEGTPSGEDVSIEEFDSVLAGTESCDDVTEGAINTVESIRSSKEQIIRSRIRFLAEEQLYSLMPKLQDLICLDGTLTFDDNLLGRRIPLFDIQREPGEPRFSKKFQSLRTLEEEELRRQYGDYLKEFADFEDNRIGSLLESSAAGLADIANTVGTSIDCLTSAFVPSDPPVGSDTDDVEFDVTDPSTWLDAAAAGTENALANAGIPDLPEIFGKLGDCTDEAVGGSADAAGLTGIAQKALAAISDSPPVLDLFATGVEPGETDEIGNLSSFTRGDSKGSFPLSDDNGALILEKYIKVRTKLASGPIELPDLDIGSTSRSDAPIGTTNESDILDTNSPPPNIPGTDSTISSFGKKTASGLGISQILCPREVMDTSSRKSSISDSRPAQTQNSIASLIPNIDTEFEQIYNIEEWQDIFTTLAASNPDMKFEDLYESWSFGIRIVYVAPTNDFEEVSSNSQPGVASQTLKIPTLPGASPNPTDFRFNVSSTSASKTYRQFERIEVERKERAIDYKFPGELAYESGETDGIVSGPEQEANAAALGAIQTYDASTGQTPSAGESIQSLSNAGGVQVVIWPQRDSVLNSNLLNDQINASQSFEKIQMERALTLLPLSEVNMPIGIAGGTKLSGVMSTINIGRGKRNSNMDELYRLEFMDSLLNSLKESPGYQLIFKYCTPSDTLLSFASIYANLLNEMSETFWDGTKAELKKLFEILMNGGDYTFEDEDEKKRGGNREQNAYAQANKGTSGATRKPALFDLAIETPKLIFKGLAEFLDPVIMPASKIVKAGKAGKLLPKFMKKLDDEGNETEENLLLKIMLGPYDLPPPVGKFSIQLPEYLQPPGYVEPTEGLSDDPSENINFEMPVFSLNDSITGQSLDPFMRGKIFPLRTGTSSEKEIYYELTKAVAQFNFPTVISIVMKIYIESMNDERCAEYLVRDSRGVPIIPIPEPVRPGDKLDLPITPVALASLPADMLAGYGPGPPHSPLGYIYHAIVATEGLDFPDIGTKERQRKKAGLENKKKPKEKLCIDIDLIREEDRRRR